MKKIMLTSFVILVFWGCHKDKEPEGPEEYVPTVTDILIPADSVILNPSGNAPLSALIKFKTNITGVTEMTVKGKHGVSTDVVQVFEDEGKYHRIPVLGLYPADTNTVQIVVTDDKMNQEKSTVKIVTGSLPENVPNYIHVDKSLAGQAEPGMNLVSSFSGFSTPPQTPYIVDSFGDIRWYLNFKTHPQLNQLFYDCGISRLKNGNFYFADGSTAKIYEVDILGKIIKTWGLSGYGFHHNVTEKPDGNFLITASKPGSTHPDGSATEEDYVLEISRNSGNIVNTWDLKESLDEHRQTLTGDTYDWFHGNGVIYDPSDQTIIVSGRVQGIVKLTQDNKVKWILAPHRGWTTNRRGEDLKAFLLTPLTASGIKISDPDVLEGTKNHTDFEWNWYQHSPQIMPNGDLLLFDNGDTRNFDGSAGYHYSRAVEFKIDPDAKTVKQIWSYGKERGGETFSRIISSVKYLPEKNHILFGPGYQVPNAVGAGGKIVELDYSTKSVVFQLSISSANGWGFHRAERLSLYPDAKPYKY